MQKFDGVAALRRLEEALELTGRIRRSMSEENTEALGRLYDAREAVLNELQEYRRSLPMDDRDFVRQWNDYTGKLLEADTELLSVLGVLRDTYQEKVRKTTQRKYLLIYSKQEQRHGY